MTSVPHKMFDVLPVGGLALPFSPLESILPGNKIETLRLQLYVVEFILSKQVKQNYLNIILNFILKTMVFLKHKSENLEGTASQKRSKSLKLNWVLKRGSKGNRIGAALIFEAVQRAFLAPRESNRKLIRLSRLIIFIL